MIIMWCEKKIQTQCYIENVDSSCKPDFKRLVGNKGRYFFSGRIAFASVFNFKLKLVTVIIKNGRYSLIQTKKRPLLKYLQNQRNQYLTVIYHKRWTLTLQRILIGRVNLNSILWCIEINVILPQSKLNNFQAVSITIIIIIKLYFSSSLYFTIFCHPSVLFILCFLVFFPVLMKIISSLANMISSSFLQRNHHRHPHPHHYHHL